MEDNFFDDDFGRTPGFVRPDVTTSFAEARETFESTSPEVHARHYEEAQAFFNNDTAREVFGDKNAAHIVDNEADLKTIAEATAKDAARAAQEATGQALKQANQQELGQVTNLSANDAAIRNVENLTNQQTGKMAGEATAAADAKHKAQVEKPTQLESTLSAIRQRPDRQDRLVITGDPAITRRFYEKLEGRGQVFYQGGAPVITVSRAKALAVLRETAKEFDGASAVHAMKLTMEREGGGPMASVKDGFFGAIRDNAVTAYQNVKAGIANNLPQFLGRQHQIDVVVVGNKSTVDAKLTELGSLLKDMEVRNHIEPGKVNIQEGKLVVPENKPAEVNGTASLDSALSVVRQKVVSYADAQAAEAADVKAWKHEKSVKDMKDDIAKSEKAAEAADGPAAPRKHVVDLATKLDKRFESPDSLHIKNDKGQHEVEHLLHLSRGLRDPVEPELANLPDQARQKAIVQMAALVEKTDTKAFGSGAQKKLDEVIDGQSSTREKINKYISMEAERSPDFAEKAGPLLQGMVERKILTEEQATKLSESITKVVAEKNAERAATQPTAEAAAGAKTESAQSTTESSATANASTTQAATEAAAGKTDASKQQGGEAKTVESAASDNGKADVAAKTETSTNQQSASTGISSETTSARAAGNESAPPSSTEHAAQAASSATESKSEAHASSRSATSSDSANQSATSSAQRGDESGEQRQANSASSGAKQASDSTTSLDANTGTRAGSAEAHTQGVDSKSSNHQGEAKAGEVKSSVQEHVGATDRSTTTSAAASDKGGMAESKVAEQKSTASTYGQSAETTSAKSSLRDSIERLANGGPAQLTEDKAHSLVAALDGIRTKPLSALDSGKGAQPTETLGRVESILKDLESGRMGGELRAMAKDLQEPLQRWKEQDAQRTQGQSAASGKAVSNTAGAGDAASTKAAADARPETAESAGKQAKESAMVSAAAKEQAAQRLWDTESAGARLAGLMANPAGSFTNRDKSWNEANIQKAAQEVLRIDPSVVGELSSAQRVKVASYAAWVADNANNGKLPGFDSAEGKAQAKQLVERASALIEKLQPGDNLAAGDVTKQLDKADRMVSAKQQLEQSASLSSQSGNSRQESASRSNISPAAANALAKDLVHAVYRTPELSESQAKYLLKNAPSLNESSIKSLEPQMQAKTAAAMSSLAESVRNGAMGDFAKLPASVQKNVVAAQTSADNLLSSLSKDPAMRAELNQAFQELNGKTSGASASKSAGMSESGTSSAAAHSSTGLKSAGNEGAVKADTSASSGKSSGRSLDR